MTKETFEQQMGRLKNTWPGPASFPSERVKIIFNAVKNLPDYWMENAVTDFIGDCRQAPLLKDFLEKIDEYEKEKTERENDNRGGSFFQTLETAHEKSGNKDFSGACMKVLRDYQSGKLTRLQFLEACDLLDEAAEKLTKKTCYDCHDTGYAFTIENNASMLSICHCKFGRERPTEYLAPKQADNTREKVKIRRLETERNPL